VIWVFRDGPGRADHGQVSHYVNLSIGEYIAMTIIPLIVLAVWGIAMYRADKYPEWRHPGPPPPQLPGAGGDRVGRSLPGSLTVPVEPTSRNENQPD
jgi:hypothetical protein